MSVGIYCRPVKNDGIHVSSSSSLYSIIDREFGIPCKLSESSVPFFRGVVACGNSDAQEIVDAIIEHGEIELFTRC